MLFPPSLRHNLICPQYLQIHSSTPVSTSFERSMGVLCIVVGLGIPVLKITSLSLDLLKLGGNNIFKIGHFQGFTFKKRSFWRLSHSGMIHRNAWHFCIILVSFSYHFFIVAFSVLVYEVRFMVSKVLTLFHSSTCQLNGTLFRHKRW